MTKKHKRKDMPRIGFKLTSSGTRDISSSTSSCPDANLLSLKLNAMRLGGNLWRERGTSHSYGSKQS